MKHILIDLTYTNQIITNDGLTKRVYTKKYDECCFNKIEKSRAKKIRHSGLQLYLAECTSPEIVSKLSTRNLRSWKLGKLKTKRKKIGNSTRATWFCSKEFKEKKQIQIRSDESKIY